LGLNPLGWLNDHPYIGASRVGTEDPVRGSPGRCRAEAGARSQDPPLRAQGSQVPVSIGRSDGLRAPWDFRHGARACPAGGRVENFT